MCESLSPVSSDTHTHAHTMVEEIQHTQPPLIQKTVLLGETASKVRGPKGRKLPRKDRNGRTHTAALPYKRQTRLASAARRWPHPNQGDINKNSNAGQKRKACYRITKDWKTDKACSGSRFQFNDKGSHAVITFSLTVSLADTRLHMASQIMCVLLSYRIKSSAPP